MNFMMQNFDNFGQASLTVFQAMTFDNWTFFVYLVSYANGIFVLPSLFFSSILLIGNYFFIGLILAVLIKAFSNTQLEKEISQEKLKNLQKIPKPKRILNFKQTLQKKAIEQRPVITLARVQTRRNIEPQTWMPISPANPSKVQDNDSQQTYHKKESTKHLEVGKILNNMNNQKQSSPFLKSQLSIRALQKKKESYQADEEIKEEPLSQESASSSDIQKSPINSQRQDAYIKRKTFQLKNKISNQSNELKSQHDIHEAEKQINIEAFSQSTMKKKENSNQSLSYASRSSIKDYSLSHFSKASNQSKKVKFQDQVEKQERRVTSKLPNRIPTIKEERLSEDHSPANKQQKINSNLEKPMQKQKSIRKSSVRTQNKTALIPPIASSQPQKEVSGLSIPNKVKTHNISEATETIETDEDARTIGEDEEEIKLDFRTQKDRLEEMKVQAHKQMQEAAQKIKSKATDIIKMPPAGQIQASQQRVHRKMPQKQIGSTTYQNQASDLMQMNSNSDTFHGLSGMDSLKMSKMDSLVAPKQQFNPLRRMSINSASIASTYKEIKEQEKESERPQSPILSHYGGLSSRGPATISKHSMRRASLNHKFISQASRSETEQTEEEEDLFEGGPTVKQSQLQIIVNSNFFNIAIFCLILGNTLVMALDRYPISQAETKVLEILNLIFTILFILEFLIKLQVLGIKGYFEDSHNKFDATIVLISVIELGITYGAKLQNMQILITFRSFRILRVLKLAKVWQRFRQLLETIVNTFTSEEMLSFTVIMSVFILVYCLIGMELFSNQVGLNPSIGVPLKSSENPPDSNFNNLYDAFLIVLIVLNNDGWSYIYFTHLKATQNYVTCVGYFHSLLFIGQFIHLNFFLAILLANFEGDSLSNEHEKMIIKWENENKMKDQENAKKQMTVEKKKEKAQNFINILLNKRQKKVLKRNQKFMDGNSFGYFSPESKFRKLCYKIVNHAFFEKIIIFLIIMTSIALILENPLSDPKSVRVQFLKTFDILMTICFTIEMIIKVISFGFAFNGPDSYLKDPWNILDFLIVTLSLIAFTFGNDANIFNFFRTIRALRPLKVITKNEGFKAAVASLIYSASDVMNGLFITFLIYFIFGIAFVSLFKGQMFQCLKPPFSDLLPHRIDKWQCLNSGAVWLIRDFQFDDILNSIMTLFNSAITVNWAALMYDLTKVEGIDYAYSTVPQNKAYSLIMAVFMISQSIFFLNIFVGIVTASFNRQHEKVSKTNLLSHFQKEWLKLLRLLLKTFPKKVLKSNSKLQKLFLMFSESQVRKFFFRFILALNCIVLTVNWYDQDQKLKTILKQVDDCLTLVFVIEQSILIIAQQKYYFQNGWQLFDLVITSLNFVGFGLSFLLKDSMYVQCLKTLKVFRLFQLLKKMKSLSVILTTFIRSIPSLLNVGGLMLLLMSIFAILGVNMFAHAKINDVLDETVNFQNFYTVLHILFRASTGESWNQIMKSIGRQKTILFQCKEGFDYEVYKDNNYETYSCGNEVQAIIYFFTYIILIKMIYFNLFKAIILNSYFDTWEELNQHFNMDTMEKFMDLWKKYDPDATGFIHKEKLPQLLFDLGYPLGWGAEDYKNQEIQDIAIHSYRLTLYNDIMDYQFYDLLEQLSKRMILNYSVNEMAIEHELKQEERINNDPKYQIKEFDFEGKMEICEKELRDIEQNEYNIQAVKKIVKLKNNFKGKGMFEYITFQEQQQLKRWIASCKTAMLQRRVLKEKKQAQNKVNYDTESSQSKSKSQPSIILDAPSQGSLKSVQRDTTLHTPILVKSDGDSVRTDSEEAVDSFMREEEKKQEEYKDHYSANILQINIHKPVTVNSDLGLGSKAMDDEDDDVVRLSTSEKKHFKEYLGSESPKKQEQLHESSQVEGLTNLVSSWKSSDPSGKDHASSKQEQSLKGMIDDAYNWPKPKLNSVGKDKKYSVISFQNVSGLKNEDLISLKNVLQVEDKSKLKRDQFKAVSINMDSQATITSKGSVVTANFKHYLDGGIEGSEHPSYLERIEESKMDESPKDSMNSSFFNLKKSKAEGSVGDSSTSSQAKKNKIKYQVEVIPIATPKVEKQKPMRDRKITQVKKNPDAMRKIRLQKIKNDMASDIKQIEQMQAEVEKLLNSEKSLSEI